jgi:CRP-like cAMP-binding protein
VTAVIGLFFEIIYFRFSGGNMHAGIGWDVVFILINLYQLYRLVAERRMLARVPDVHLLKQGVFCGLDDGQLARLIPSGRWKSFASGAVIAREGEPVKELVLICEGDADVEVSGKNVARLAGGTFVGEMAFASGYPASATVTACRPVRAFVFDMDSLRAAVEADESVASSLHTVVGRDLAAKLRSRNKALE